MAHVEFLDTIPMKPQRGPYPGSLLGLYSRTHNLVFLVVFLCDNTPRLDSIMTQYCSFRVQLPTHLLQTSNVQGLDRAIRLAQSPYGSKYPLVIYLPRICMAITDTQSKYPAIGYMEP